MWVAVLLIINERGDVIPLIKTKYYIIAAQLKQSFQTAVRVRFVVVKFFRNIPMEISTSVCTVIPEDLDGTVISLSIIVYHFLLCHSNYFHVR